MNIDLDKVKKEDTKRYIYKNQSLYLLIQKIKLWPSRSGILHGLKSVERKGRNIYIKTHCGEEFIVWDSKNSRSARWLRNRWCTFSCQRCKIPDWKLKKYSSTVFTGSSEKLNK
ncbi:UNVERIFIED_CONTAM: pyrrolysyl-tRNA synthetase-like protein [Acetivibrio alkalicellulosi]